MENGKKKKNKITQKLTENHLKYLSLPGQETVAHTGHCNLGFVSNWLQFHTRRDMTVILSLFIVIFKCTTFLTNRISPFIENKEAAAAHR